ncbi:ubiquinone biosynthesis O-methyltransferase, mitochondrial-like isoform X2 [Cornus florida]|uniref:ubiquinone biosynthesis O-methyltransferase, mitochondrial-like isoform X2 n=1 Tax=Cornus florida TaxID=4283 RepID=UPI0028965432|nr:ubiquinone biosynthesis O-methyltransferase, mitochondrial-like isoform X2 [Cornus florida]
MASKLLNHLRILCKTDHHILRFSNPSPNFSLKRSIFRAPQTILRIRPYSDVPQPVPINPSLPEKPPINGDTTNDVKNVTRVPTSSSSLNEAELLKFSSIAETWWDAKGPFKPLHVMNPTRVTFIRSTLCRHFRKDPNCARPFEGLKFVDVGCGGGILSEVLDPVTSAIEYRCTTAEKLVEEQREFDAVIASEVIEHVANPAEFCKSLASLTVSSGATVISTLNRSMRSYATAIIAAEYLLHWLPKGTHQWSSFLTPEELVLILQRASITVQEMAGIVYKPLTGGWALSDDVSVNYIAFCTKKGPIM